MTVSVFHNLRQAPHLFYREYEQAKIKFGSEQVEKNGDKRMRKVSSPIARLKEEQRRLLKRLEEFILPGCMYGGVRGRNNILNALQHLNGKYFFTVDLKNFFKNISNAQIHQTLIGLGITWVDARKITRVTTLNQSLPQGAPTSTILSNLAFVKKALILAAYCEANNITFTIFVDDLTFSSPKCFKHHKAKILELISGKNFRINHSKIHYRKNSCEITGLIVKKRKLQLPKIMLQHIDKPGIRAYANRVERMYAAHISQKIN
jgi:RNA-directed DNA polymerase